MATECGGCCACCGGCGCGGCGGCGSDAVLHTKESVLLRVPMHLFTVAEHLGGKLPASPALDNQQLSAVEGSSMGLDVRMDGVRKMPHFYGKSLRASFKPTSP